ncbi:MAG: autotransporter outer membrane beta-barrel domain-containing protein [Burkholderiales bacterium]
MPNAGRATVWARSFGSWDGFDGDGNAARLDRDIGGPFIGADVPVGGLLGFSHSHFSPDARNSAASNDDYHAALYGGTQRGASARPTLGTTSTAAAASCFPALPIPRKPITGRAPLQSQVGLARSA